MSTVNSSPSLVTDSQLEDLHKHDDGTGEAETTSTCLELFPLYMHIPLEIRRLIIEESVDAHGLEVVCMATDRPPMGIFLANREMSEWARQVYFGNRRFVYNPDPEYFSACPDDCWHHNSTVAKELHRYPVYMTHVPRAPQVLKRMVNLDVVFHLSAVPVELLVGMLDQPETMAVKKLRLFISLRDFDSTFLDHLFLSEVEKVLVAPKHSKASKVVNCAISVDLAIALDPESYQAYIGDEDEHRGLFPTSNRWLKFCLREEMGIRVFKADLARPNFTEYLEKDKYPIGGHRCMVNTCVFEVVASVDALSLC